MSFENTPGSNNDDNLYGNNYRRFLESARARHKKATGELTKQKQVDSEETTKNTESSSSLIKRIGNKPKAQG